MVYLPLQVIHLHMMLGLQATRIPFWHCYDIYTYLYYFKHNTPLSQIARGTFN